MTIVAFPLELSTLLNPICEVTYFSKWVMGLGHTLENDSILFENKISYPKGRVWINIFLSLGRERINIIIEGSVLDTNIPKGWIKIRIHNLE